LDDFVWFYGASLEALRNGMTMTALGKLQRALTYLLRYFLVKNKILLRKPLPDERTLAQLQKSSVPKELISLVKDMYEKKVGIKSLLMKTREVYQKVTEQHLWLGQVPI